MSKLTHEWMDLTALRKGYQDEAASAGKSFVVKVYGDDAVGLELDKGDYVATVATDTPDDDKEIVQPKNFDLRRFQKVMAVHLDHDIESLPIGRCKWIKANEHSLIAKYFISQATPETRAIDYMLQEGVLHQHSVSFIGDKAVAPTQKDVQLHPNWAGNKVYKGQPLFIEFSVVGQPANSDCSMIAIGKQFGLSQTSIDRITGKTARTDKVAAEVTAAVEENVPVIKSEKDIKGEVCKRLEQVIADVNYDAILAKAMQSLCKKHL
jgi:phage head maturation protease